MKILKIAQANTSMSPAINFPIVIPTQVVVFAHTNTLDTETTGYSRAIRVKRLKFIVGNLYRVMGLLLRRIIRIVKFGVVDSAF